MTREVGNYLLLSKLGEGGMAEVWLGEHKRNRRKAAIKILKLGSMPDEDYERVFLREAQVLAALDHPNIARIYDNDRVDDEAWLAMELLPGGTLQERMRAGPISVGEAIALVVQLAQALAVAHAQQLIHRDLKPANVMFRADGVPVLTDFGAVRVLDQSTIFGKDGGIIGTPRYMSPEQICGQPLSGRSDLYALGLVFYELLVGRSPFDGQSTHEIISQHLHAPVPPLPAALAPLQPVMDRLLAKQADARFGSAGEVVDALRAVFLSSETLRQQIGFAGNEAAWSSQLRALGFVLGNTDQAQVRVAQGAYLAGGRIGSVESKAGTDPTAPIPGPSRRAAGGDASDPLTRPVLAVPAVAESNPVSASPRPGRARWAITAGILLCAAALGLWWLSSSPETPTELPAAATGVQPAERFARSQLGIRDASQSLLWAFSDNGADLNWLGAVAFCASKGPAWTLPSRHELTRLYDPSAGMAVEVQTSAGAVTLHPATRLIQWTGAFYWTSEVSTEAEAYGVFMGEGSEVSWSRSLDVGARALCVSR